MRLRRETGGPVFTVDLASGSVEPAVIRTGFSPEDFCGVMFEYNAPGNTVGETIKGFGVITNAYYVYDSLFKLCGTFVYDRIYYNAGTGELSVEQPDVPDVFTVNEDYTVTPGETFVGVPIAKFAGKSIADGESTATIIADMLPYPEPEDGICKIQYSESKVLVYDKNTGKLYAEPYEGE